MQEDSKLPREIQIHRRSARLASVDVMQTSLRVEECWDLNCFRGFAAVLCDGITRVIGGERNEMEFFWNDGGQV